MGNYQTINYNTDLTQSVSINDPNTTFFKKNGINRAVKTLGIEAILLGSFISFSNQANKEPLITDSYCDIIYEKEIPIQSIQDSKIILENFDN